MKKWKLFTAAVLSAATLFTSVWTVPVYAEEGDVTEKPYISADFSNRIDQKKIAQEDADVINEKFGYEWGSNTVNICGKDTSLWIDIENSLYGYDIYRTTVFSPVLYRDENGTLNIKDLGGEDFSISTFWDWNTETNTYQLSDGYLYEYEYDYDYNDGVLLSWIDFEKGTTYGNIYFSINQNDDYAINTHLGNTAFLEPKLADDVYIVRVFYLIDGDRSTLDYTYGWVDYWILPEGVESVLHFENMEAEPTPSEEQYVVDLTNAAEPISKEDFAVLLEENKTKDVVISSNNGVTFTFKAGTMSEVEGKEAYDFSTSIQNTYESTMPSYVTASNFVSQINFNYSGTLPADAYIRFFVGTQYAGQTLYYSLMNEAGTFAEVQAVTVDAEGYMTVKQSHCSSYVVTTENPETPAPTPEAPAQPEQPQTPTPEQSQTQAPEQSQTATPDTTPETAKTSPKTGEKPFQVIYVLAFAAIGIAAVSVAGKKRNMR